MAQRTSLRTLWEGLALPFSLASLLLVQLLYAFNKSFFDDEFTNLSHAVRVLHGAVFYRDFFEFITPLSHWLLVPIFFFTGPSILAARLFQTVLLTFAGWQIFSIGRRLGAGHWVAALPALVLAWALYRHWPGYSHHWIALPLVLGTAQLAMTALENAKGRWWFFSGVLSACTFWALQSDGMIILFAVLGAIVFQAILNSSGWLRTAKRLFQTLLGFMVPMGFVLAYFALNKALPHLWNDLWVFPITQYRSAGNANDFSFASDLPYTVLPVTALPFWYGRLFHFIALMALPIASAVLGAFWGAGKLLHRVRMGPACSARQAQFGLLALMAIGFFLLATKGRADYIHVAQYALPSVLLAVLAAGEIARRFDVPEFLFVRWIPLLTMGAFALSGGLMVASSFRQEADSRFTFESPDQAFASTPIIRYIREHTTATDRILAMPVGGYYYVYARPAATRFTAIFPPEIKYCTEQDWTDVWVDVAQNKPKFIVLSPLESMSGMLPSFHKRMGGYHLVRVFREKPVGGLHVAYLYQRNGQVMR